MKAVDVTSETYKQSVADPAVQHVSSTARIQNKKRKKKHLPCHGLSVHVHGVLMLSVAFNLVRMEGLCTFVRARLLMSAGSPSVFLSLFRVFVPK